MVRNKNRKIKRRAERVPLVPWWGKEFVPDILGGRKKGGIWTVKKYKPGQVSIGERNYQNHQVIIGSGKGEGKKLARRLGKRRECHAMVAGAKEGRDVEANLNNFKVGGLVSCADYVQE